MRAILSVYDKTGIVDFAKGLIEQGVEIVSSGGTYDLLKAEGIPVVAVPDVTGFPECLGGRVKTLHPRIHAGILANRAIPEHMETLRELDVQPVDYVVVNLYPFAAVTANPDHTLAQAIENIDIGGPSLIRAAAKNYSSVMVLTDSADYAEALEHLQAGTADVDYRFGLAVKAFTHTAEYDAMISRYLQKCSGEEYPETVNLTLHKKQLLRYGENPHQSAAYYQNADANYNGIEGAVTLHGKELSYNNINDAQGAIALTMEFIEPACIAVKHATPCGVGIADLLEAAFDKAYACDPVSIFGGIVCCNRPVDLATARKLKEIFLEVIIAPAYEADALEVLIQKKNVRILVLEALKTPQVLPNKEYKSVGGGFLLQQTDAVLFDGNNRTVTEAQTDAVQQADLEFAMKVVKHVKSNAIVVVKNGRTLGIGGGEVSRIWAAQAALARAGEHADGAVVGSDAFFPFADVVEACADAGIKAIIQPGGSNNDQLSIDACNQRGIAMVFTGVRHFKH